MAQPVVISYSELASMRCPLQHQLSYIERWTHIPDPMSPLGKGTAWHLAMETHYKEIKHRQDRDLRGEQSTLTAASAAVERAIEEQVEPGSSDLADLVWWMYRGYTAKWGADAQWRVLAVEHAAQCRLPTPSGRPSGFILKMKIDLIAQDLTTRGNQIWIIDHKSLDDESLIITRNGVVRIGDVTAGEHVLGSDGNWTLVTATTRSAPNCYRIRLRNGTEFTCSDRHRWPVERAIHTGRYKTELLSTRQLINRLAKGEQYRMLPAPAIKMPNREYLVDPYLLGALLGDGGFTRFQTYFTKSHGPTLNRVTQRLPEKTYVTRSKTQSSGVVTLWFTGTLNSYIESLGLGRKHGLNKFIPSDYLLGSFDQRLELLRGLMDTDGSHRKGVPLYQTGSKRLAEDVRRLVESLGGVATVWCNKNPKHQNGVGKPNWEIKMRFPREFPVPYHHEDKIARHRVSHKTLGERLVIESIEPVGPRSCTDIEVTATDSLFSIGGVLTHNSCRNLPKGKELELDDQFGLYTWGLRSMRKKVFGQIHNAARTERLVAESKVWGTSEYVTGEVQALPDRFVRTPTYRTDIELDTIAVEAYLTARARYDQQRQLTKQGVDSPRRTDPSTCRFLCNYLDPCLAGRKGVNMREYLHDRGFRRDPTRN